MIQQLKHPALQGYQENDLAQKLSFLTLTRAIADSSFLYHKVHQLITLVLYEVKDLEFGFCLIYPLFAKVLFINFIISSVISLLVDPINICFFSKTISIEFFHIFLNNRIYFF